MNSPVWKYVSSEHAQKVATGQFRFGSARFYRLLEHATGDSLIGDRDEALRTARVDRVVVSPTDPDATDPEQSRIAAKIAGVSYTEDASVRIYNTTVRTEITCFLLCFSRSPVHENTPTSVIFDPYSSYDSCVKFEALESLAEQIALNGLLGGHERIDGQPVSQFFDVMFGPVEYCDIQRREGLVDFRDAHAFQKKLQYAPQHEARIVLVPRDGFWLRKEDAVFVNCRSISGERFDLPGVKNGERKTLVRSKDDCIRELIDIAHAVNKLAITDYAYSEFMRKRRRTRFQESGDTSDDPRDAKLKAKIDGKVAVRYWPLLDQFKVNYWHLRNTLGKSDQLDDALEHPEPRISWLPREILEYLIDNSTSSSEEPLRDLFSYVETEALSPFYGE